MTPNHKVLMLAQYFPPLHGVGGVIRVTKFIKYLPMVSTWVPVVVTLEDREDYAFLSRGSVSLLADIPPTVKVFRTRSFEPRGRSVGEALGEDEVTGSAFRSVLTRLLRCFRRIVQNYVMIPDLHILWLPFVLPAARKVAKDEAVDLLFTTCPPHSSAAIAALVQCLTGLPLVVDFRDDWTGDPWPPIGTADSAFARAIQRWMEKRVVRQSTRVVTVTERSLRGFRTRYPDERPDKFVLIPNGCDLSEYEFLRSIADRPTNQRFTITYAGRIEPARAPTHLFEAIHRLREDKRFDTDRLDVVFLGGLPHTYQRLVDQLGLAGVIRHEPPMPQGEALFRRLWSSDVLLAIADPSKPTSMAGKIYGYWGVGGPALLLLAEDGAAKDFCESHGLGVVVSLSDVDGITQAIAELFERWEQGVLAPMDQRGIERYDRKALTRQLAGEFDRVIGEG